MKKNVNPKIEINKKKMQKFLQSLRTTTREEMGERQRVAQLLSDVNLEYQTIRNTASSLVFTKDRTIRRNGDVPKVLRKSQPRPDFEEAEKPKYVPASKYPLPMQPMPFLVKKESVNAARVLNLSKLRKNPNRESEQIVEEVPPSTVVDDFPQINVEKIGRPQTSELDD